MQPPEEEVPVLPPPSEDPLCVNEAKARLFKVPLFVAESWRHQAAGDVVGVYCQGANGGAAKLLLCAPQQVAANQQPQQHLLQQLECRKTPTSRTYIISEVTDGGGHHHSDSPFSGAALGGDANAHGLTVEAAVVESITAAPAVEDAKYQSILKSRQENSVTRSVLETAVELGGGRHLPRLFKYYHDAGGGNADDGDNDEDDGMRDEGGGGFSRRGKGHGSAAAGGPESAQMRKDDIRMKLFEIFESSDQARLTMTDLTKLTRQPQHSIKPLLDEIAVAQTGGSDRRRVFYQLKPEYSSST